jgi:hypothetical protein
MNKLNKIIKLCCLLLIYMSYSCSEDYEVHHHNDYENKIKVTPITIQDVQKNSKAFEKLTIPKSRLNANSSINRIINDTINNFSVETNYGVYIETENYHSYTFKILRPNGSNYLLENIVVSKITASEYETILYQYDITADELHMIEHGEFVNLEGKINKIFLENSLITTEVTGKYYFNGHCFEDIPSYVQGQTCQGEGFLNHTYEEVLAGQYCSQFGTSAGPQPGYYTWQTIEVACDDNGGGGTGGASSYSGGSGGTGGPRAITTPINNCITGNCIEANPTDPCLNANTAVANANALFNTPQVQQGMNAVLNQKINDEGQLPMLDQKEWGVAIGQTGSTYNVTAPRRGSTNQGSIPYSQVSGNYVADGHSHPNWGYADPSAGDLYGMLTSMQTNTNLKYRFVYGVGYGNSQDIDTYALIVTDPNAAQAFLIQFPEIQNTNSETHGFLEDTKLGTDYLDAKRLFGRGFSSNLSDETYAPGAVGLAAILDKNNAGICIAKKDANGNFKKINATLVEKTDANGNKTQEVIVSKCQ